MVENIPPPQDPVIASSIKLDDLLDDLRGRISILEAEREHASLSAEADYKKLLISEVKQRINIRYIAFGLSGFVILVMMAFGASAIWRYYMLPSGQVPPSLAIATIVAPIVSISAITITILIGAFRRFKDDDVDKIDTASITSQAAKTLTAQ